MMKTVLVTGSSHGIGKVIALKLAEKHKVIITGRNEDALKQLSASNTNIIAYYALDLTKSNSVEELFHFINKECASVDVLINNAGSYAWLPMGRDELYLEKTIENIFKLNTQIPYELCKKFSPAMKQKRAGRIINIGSISGVVGEPNASLYSSSKASLIGLTKSLALELAEDNITVNLINPGWVETELTNKALSEIEKREVLETIPQRRWVDASDIADMCNYLVSDSAKSITGQSINICAGLSLG
ncbi:MAG TPA: SDR family oxidoreductase [Vampirovibrionales bacterium]